VDLRREVVLRGDLEAVERLAAGFRAVDARLDPELDFARDAVDLPAVALRALDFRAVDFRAVDFRAPLRVEPDDELELVLASPSIDHLPDMTR
jgi:hypothetical protein